MERFNNKINRAMRFITGLAALGLPLVHTVETFILLEIVGPSSGLFCDLIISLVIFGPSIFMICMGADLSEKKSPKHLFNTGLIFLLYGIILTVLRSIIPIILVCSVVPTTFDHIFSFMFLSDIYLFVGLFYMTFSLFVKLKLSPASMLLVSAVMLIVNTALSGIFKTDVETVNALIGNIVYVDDGSVFPLLSWSIFPTFGYFAKKFLESKSDKKAAEIMKISAAVSTVSFAAAAVILSVLGYDVLKIIVSPLNGYRTGIINVVLLLSLNTAIIGDVFLIIDTVPKSKIFLSVSWLSRNIIPFFTVHWLTVTTVCYGMTVFYTLTEKFISVPMMLAAAVFITVSSLLITKKVGYKLVKPVLKAAKLNGLIKLK